MSLKIMDFVFQNIRESSMWNEHATTKFLTGNKFGKVFVNTNNFWCLFDMFGIVYCVVWIHTEADLGLSISLVDRWRL